MQILCLCLFPDSHRNSPQQSVFLIVDLSKKDSEKKKIQMEK